MGSALWLTTRGRKSPTILRALRFNRQEMADALALVCQVAAVRTPKEILKCVRLEARFVRQCPQMSAFVRRICG